MQTYDVFALRYGTQDRPASENFLFSLADEHDLRGPDPMPIDYFLWLIQGQGRSVLVDTGFDRPAGERRGRTMLQHPVDGLRAMGVDPASVADVVITHLHYDHAGNLGAFPNATFHLQDAEMAFATGRCMCRPGLRSTFEVEDVVAMVRRVYAGRVRFHDGDAALGPGLSLHRVAGHTRGLQAVRVATGRGMVVLAADALHFYANMEHQNPFPILVDVAGTMEGWRRLGELADTADHVVPGHDPRVRRTYPRHGVEGVEAYCLHVPPRDEGASATR